MTNYNQPVLQILDLSFNPIEHLMLFENFKLLKKLILSYTRLTELKSLNFWNVNFLNELHIIGCQINHIEKGLFVKNDLRSIDLASTVLPKSELKFLVENLKEIINIRSDYPLLCCFIKTRLKTLNCSSSSSLSSSLSSISDCYNLISSDILAVTFFLIGFSGIFLNILSIMYFFFNGMETKFILRTFSLIYDVTSSIYLIILSIKNYYFKNKFFENENSWTKSSFCFLTGSLLNFSILCSTMNTLNISVNGYFFKEKNMNKFILVEFLNILINILLVSIPLFFPLVKFFVFFF